MFMNLKIKLAAVRVIIKRLGVKSLSSIGLELSKSKKKGKPYDGLSAASSKKDKDSRALIAEAIVLYDILKQQMDQAKAEQIVREVITAAAIAQLSCLIPTLKSEKLAKLSKEERQKLFCGIVEKFPNTDWILIKSEDNEYEFHMTRCRLCEIFIEVGIPELKNSCCAGDALYFERFQKGIEFNRNKMIGENDEYCLFNFKLKN